MEKSLIVIGVLTAIGLIVAMYACLKVASDDDEREGRD